MPLFVLFDIVGIHQGVICKYIPYFLYGNIPAIIDRGFYLYAFSIRFKILPVAVIGNASTISRCLGHL